MEQSLSKSSSEEFQILGAKEYCIDQCIYFLSITIPNKSSLAARPLIVIKFYEADVLHRYLVIVAICTATEVAWRIRFFSTRILQTSKGNKGKLLFWSSSKMQYFSTCAIINLKLGGKNSFFVPRLIEFFHLKFVRQSLHQTAVPVL